MVLNGSPTVPSELTPGRTKPPLPIVFALSAWAGAYVGLSVQREGNMSRIHEALLKAEQERNVGQVANATTLSLGAAHLRLVTENSGTAKEPEASTRAGVVIPPPSSAYLRFDTVVAHCAHPQWHPEPNANVFNSTAGPYRARSTSERSARDFAKSAGINRPISS